jgi:transposase
VARRAGAPCGGARADQHCPADDRRARHAARPVGSGAARGARKQTGCRALVDQIYGVGGLIAVTTLAELGDTRRFQNSRDVIRYAGLDITVYQSDAHRAPGHLSRQGPPALRWALYEAAQRARFPTSPDRAYYLQAAQRIGGNRACLALARKLLKRSYHILKELGDPALQPVAS